MYTRILLLLPLATALVGSVSPRPVRAQAPQDAGSISLLYPTEAECNPRGAARTAMHLCVVGIARHPAGVEQVLVNRVAATTRPDSADGGTRFVGFVPTGGELGEVEVVALAAGGARVAQRYEVILEGDPAAPEGPSYRLVNRNPRLLGESAAPGSADAQVAAPAAQDTLAPPAAGGDAPAAPPADETRQWIQILEPREWAGEGVRGITVQARRSVRVAGVAMHPTGATRVEIDGRPAAAQPDPGGGLRFVGYVPADTASREVVITVRGAVGPPVVRQYALTATPAEKSFSTPQAAWTPEQGFRGKRWAVVVGISEYQDTSIKALRYADADARAFYNFLRSERAGAGGFPEENIRLLLNEQATYREIRSALRTFLKAATEEDQVVIYFAGHGSPDPQRLNKYYLLTYDTDYRDVSGTAFPMEDVDEATRELYARNVIVITDACHSAGVSGQFATRDLGINQINSVFLEQLNASRGGLVVFTASGANQLSQEDERWGGGHGVFTHYLIEGLNGAADQDGDQIVTLLEMMEWTRSNVMRETQNAQIPTISQTPYDQYLPVSIVLAGSARATAPTGPSAGTPAPSPASPRTSALSPAAAEALARAQEAVRLFPRSAQYRRNLGQALKQAGRPEEALAEFAEAAKLDPENAAARYDLGIALHEAGMLPQALSEFQVAVRLDPRNARYFNDYGAALLAANQEEEALDRYRRAVRLDPSSASFHRNLAHVLVRSGKLQDAVAELRQATTLAPDNAAYHWELGGALDGQGSTLEAITEYRAAVRLEPKSPVYRYALASALRKSDARQEAREELQEAVRLEPRNPRYHFELGVLYREAGMQYESIVSFREAVRLEPANAVYRYELGVGIQRSDQPQEAVKELEEAVRLEPANAAYRNALGVALRGSGHPSEALEQLLEAVRLQPGEARYHFDLGELYVESGQWAEAVAALQEAVRLDSRNNAYKDALRSARRKASP
ncbi:MAG TPA: tetratricopeptide repeat protein [Longimicrobiaceae bacterium]|nr:tetratricopeptide repeat protein [Longimicrobiaceae bacterium]